MTGMVLIKSSRTHNYCGVSGASKQVDGYEGYVKSALFELTKPTTNFGQHTIGDYEKRDTEHTANRCVHRESDPTRFDLCYLVEQSINELLSYSL
jgi:hypothetical protein